MIDTLFFPNKPDELVDTKHFETIVHQAYDQMHTYLHKQVDDGGLKTKLHDQLIWLQHQIQYFNHSHDVEHLLENFNWVVTNFNHDLSLVGDQLFKNIHP